MSDDPQDNLDLFDDHEEIVSEDGKRSLEEEFIYSLIY